MRLRVEALAAVALTAAAVLSPTAIHAGRPLDTEDTGIVDPGAGEVETGLDLAREGGTNAFGSRLVVSLGVAPQLELRVEAGVAAIDYPGEASRAGVGDSLVGLKYRLLDESLGRPAVLVAAAARLPTGDARRDLGEPDAASRRPGPDHQRRLRVRAVGPYRRHRDRGPGGRTTPWASAGRSWPKSSRSSAI